MAPNIEHLIDELAVDEEANQFWAVLGQLSGKCEQKSLRKRASTTARQGETACYVREVQRNQ